MTGRVIVVGSVNVDLVVRAPRLPAPGETVTGGTFARSDGGKGGNQAVAAARLGARVSIVGAVGDDELGGQARAALAREGVDVSELATLPGATGVALVVVGPDGDNLIAVASGANAHVDVPGVRAALERLAPVAGDVVLVGHEIPTASAREALRLARAAASTTILNPAPATGLDRSVVGLADVLTPNRSELATLVDGERSRIRRPELGGGDVLRAAQSLVGTDAEGVVPGAVVVTLGAAGAVLVRAGWAPVELPAPWVDAVDATGAGDALNGALAAALAAGHGLEGAARAAVVAASLSTTASGARGGLPTAAQLASAGAEASA